MVATVNKQVIFSKVPTGVPVPGEHVTVVETTIDLDAPLTDGQILLKSLKISVDPMIRGQLRLPGTGKGLPPIPLGSPITGFVISKVIKSNNPKFKRGDLVSSFPAAFQEYTLLSPGPLLDGLRTINESKTNGLPISYYLGVLGMPGLTAYGGLLEIGKPKAGETLFVSAASGAVGQLVGQIGKVLGLHVIGSAGSDEKVAFLKEELNFDSAFNYKTSSVDESLTKLAPEGIDIYFDNVGGETLESAIGHAKSYGRIALCGMVSEYNNSGEHYGVRNLFDAIIRHLKIEGFAVTDYYHLSPKFDKEVTEWLLEGKIKYRESVANGIEQTPQALTDVVTGKNFGKQVVHLAEQ
ncbi:hypothetical protein BJV82DRAFT_672130 [Fennellomyces sp. T-0311]|nr:hypothetical protein BJV82DRAFT_672130 [Fennellomyces sp. T-0311]